MQIKKSILIVGDDEILSQTMAFILNRAGYLVATGLHLDEAMQHLASARYDLIILDIKVLDASSISRIQDILRSIPDSPLIVLSGSIANEINGSTLVSDRPVYLIKPIDPDCILKKVNEILVRS